MISRHARVQDKKATRRGVFLIFLSFALLAAMFFFGLPTLARFAGIVINLRSSDQPIVGEDTTAPGPPAFFIQPPTHTKEKKLEIEGRAEAGSTVKFYKNDEVVKELLIDDSSSFNVTISLTDGENWIWAKATDQAGNESVESTKIHIYYDTEAPSLEILEPVDGTPFSGGTKSITVKGKTDKEARVTVNERLTIVSAEGDFNQKINLQEGENTITIVAEDEGGNQSEKTITVTYSP